MSAPEIFPEYPGPNPETLGMSAFTLDSLVTKGEPSGLGSKVNYSGDNLEHESKSLRTP